MTSAKVERNLSANCWSTVGWQTTNRLPPGYRHVTDTSPTVGDLSADCRPNGRAKPVSWLSVDCRPSVGRQLADRFFGELFFTITELSVTNNSFIKNYPNPNDHILILLGSNQLLSHDAIIYYIVLVLQHNEQYDEETYVEGRGFINVFSKSATGFHMEGKRFELNYFVEKTFLWSSSNQASKLIFTACLMKRELVIHL